MANKRKKEEHEEHMDETWLVPYADILTLLLALFIVLFASSQIDSAKFKAIETAFKQAFQGNAGILDSGQNPIPLPEPATPQQSSPENINKENNNLKSLQDNINRFIAQNNLQGKIDTSITDEGLVFEINNELLFNRGGAQLGTNIQPLISKIADLLSMTTQQIIISGHTDDRPINTEEFPSNWDLSSKRAINVMKSILAQNQYLQPQRFSAIGYGEYRPTAPNITEENRTKNRRVEILLVRTYPIIKN